VGYFEEAIEQVDAALAITEGKPIFKYYKAAILFSLGNQKKPCYNWKMLLSLHLAW
jgi:hypothetical protein